MKRFLLTCIAPAILGAAAIFSGCQLFQKAAPSTVNLVACVLNAADQGQTIGEIANTCSADVVAVVEVLVTAAQTNAAVGQTKAYHECRELLIIAPLEMSGVPQ